MIPISKLTKAINDGLNALAKANDFPFTFAIKSEGGEYMPPKRNGNKVEAYINGVTKIVDSEVIPVQGTSVLTQSVNLTLAYPLPDDIPVEDAIAPVRALLDTYFKQTFIQAMPDDSGNDVAVSGIADIPTTGEIALNTGPGLMCTFTCGISYNFIENGVNSNKFILLFDNVIIPYMDATVTRVPVMAANPYSGTDGAAASVTESTALNIEFTAHTLKSENNAFFTAYKSFILNGNNPPHIVTIKYEDTNQVYSMKFGQSSLSLEGIKNGNSRISLVSAKELNDEQ